MEWAAALTMSALNTGIRMNTQLLIVAFCQPVSSLCQIKVTLSYAPLFLSTGFFFFYVFDLYPSHPLDLLLNIV